jgi:hypothetical protein
MERGEHLVRVPHIGLKLQNFCSIPVAFLLLYFFCYLPNPAFAQVAVNDVIRHFAAGDRPVDNVVVSNSSNDPVYVSVEATEVVNPGSGGQ